MHISLPKISLPKIFLLIGFFSSYWLFSQTQKDTTQILALLTQGESFEGTNPDSAILLERNALTLSKHLNYQKWESESYYYIGWALINKGLYDEAMLVFDSAIYICKKCKLLVEIPKSYNGKAACYQHLGDYEKAATQYLAALKVLESLPPSPKVQNNIAKIEFNIAVTFKQIQNYQDSEKYLQKASLFYLNAKDTSNYIDCLNNFSSLYSVQNDSIKEFSYIQKAFNLSRSYGKTNKKTQETIFFNYGKMLEKTGKPAEGILYKEKALALAQENGAFYAARTALGVGESYLAAQKWEAAQKCQNIIQQYAENSHSLRAYMDACWLQSQIEAGLGKYKNAYFQHIRYKKYGDSLLSTEKSKAVAQLERQFEGAKKDKIILQNQLTIVQQKQGIWAALLGIFMLISLVFFIWQYYRTNKKQHEQAILNIQQNQEIKTMKALITGEENERSRIAKELHDSVGGLLSTVRLHFDALKNRTDELRENQDYEYALSLLDESSQYIRQISHNLMPEILTRYNLIKALQTYTENISRSKILSVDFQYFGIEEAERFSPHFELMVYRIVQELLSNIMKHAAASEAFLQLNRNDNILSITIEDNGKGFNSKNMENEQAGMGLEGIKNKINYIGGQIDIHSQNGVGTSIFIQLTLQK